MRRISLRRVLQLLMSIIHSSEPTTESEPVYSPPTANSQKQQPFTVLLSWMTTSVEFWRFWFLVSDLFAPNSQSPTQTTEQTNNANVQKSKPRSTFQTLLVLTTSFPSVIDVPTIRHGDHVDACPDGDAHCCDDGGRNGAEKSRSSAGPAD